MKDEARRFRTAIVLRGFLLRGFVLINAFRHGMFVDLVIVRDLNAVGMAPSRRFVEFLWIDQAEEEADINADIAGYGCQISGQAEFEAREAAWELQFASEG